MSNEVNTPSVVALWLISLDAPFMPITLQEERISGELPSLRSRAFRHSRGYLRQALAGLYNLKPLEIPLFAPPGKPPELKAGWGYISLSHCRDAVLIGWSLKRIGIDLERMDRSFSASQVACRYFSSKEKEEIADMPHEILRTEVLDRWLRKEAAIKWQRGKLAIDLLNWQCDQESNVIFHDKFGYSLSVYRQNYLDWGIAVAAEEDAFYRDPVLCVCV
ncbi:4'-phosphopantetheinyl transferase family protein [Prochlorococcus sp. MIT 1341]|uniref:4'-phosphopantetheinyl transferase family protein n=1 Tax=Prochlorococcus sp. MIT 1341 TaxID=3096221 RepID=UPI002A75ED92|nr:4'-phosphopantetheinyl transferase superfamily protein [Prochlorococcus sp. MIT 1341]